MDLCGTHIMKLHHIKRIVFAEKNRQCGRTVGKILYNLTLAV